MAIARSRITSQGQISIPAEIRKRLGLRSGSVLEWEERDGAVVVRRAGGSTWEGLRAAVFPEGPPKPRALAQLKAGLREHARRRYAEWSQPRRKGTAGRQKSKSAARLSPVKDARD
ncbi:MAG: AbrB/MazE/SpoVT family DNA-binding domain-containing protein [Terriglobales bacterium]